MTPFEQLTHLKTALAAERSSVHVVTDETPEELRGAVLKAAAKQPGRIADLEAKLKEGLRLFADELTDDERAELEAIR